MALRLFLIREKNDLGKNIFGINKKYRSATAYPLCNRFFTSQVKMYSPGVHRAGRHMPRGLPAERARARVQAVLQQLEAVWDGRTCAGAAAQRTSDNENKLQ